MEKSNIIIAIIMIIISFVTIFIMLYFGIKYLVIAPALSWGIYCLYHTMKNSEIKPIKDASILAKYWTRLGFALIFLCVVGEFLLGNKYYFDVLGHELSKAELLLILIVILSALITAISMGFVYKKFVAAFKGTEKFGNKDKKLLFVMMMIASVLVTYYWPEVAEKLLLGEEFTFYKGNWLIAIVVTCAYVSVFFLVTSFFCLRGITQRFNNNGK